MLNQPGGIDAVEKRRRGMRFVFLFPLVSSKDLEQMLGDTPPVWKGSSNLFRNLQEGGRGCSSS